MLPTSVVPIANVNTIPWTVSPEFCPVLTLFARAACKVESCVRIMAAAIVLPVHVLSLLLTEVLQMLL